MQRFDGKTVLVVGGSTGIGFAGAARVVREGGHVIIAGRNHSSLEAARDQLGERAFIYQGDAADSTLVESILKAPPSDIPGITAFLHVAGGSGRRHGDGPLHELSDEGLEFTLNLNLKSLIYTNRAAVRFFLAQGMGGTILNVGSVLGHFPSPAYFATHAYAATKAAVVGFTRSVASYYAPRGIRVNVLSPALVETPMAQRACTNQEIQEFIRTKQPLDGGRVGVPQDLEGTMAHLLSDEARFITGQEFIVDGGWSVSEGQIAQVFQQQPNRRTTE